MPYRNKQTEPAAASPWRPPPQNPRGAHQPPCLARQRPLLSEIAEMTHVARLRWGWRRHGGLRALAIDAAAAFPAGALIATVPARAALDRRSTSARATRAPASF